MQKTKELVKQKNKKNRGITLIALVITIIVLIILAGISISLVLGENGLFNKAKSAATETAKARFVEDAGFAYSEAYIEKVETSNANDITIGAVVEKLKSSYGYTEEQIVTVTSGVSDITLSETEVTLEPGETAEVTVELENGTYYALIEGLYYPITLSNGEVALGEEGLANLPDGDGTTSTITAEVTSGNENDLVDVTVDGTTITIKTKKGQEQVGEETVTVTYGGIKKEIKITIKYEIKQGDELPLGPVSVTVNGLEQTLAHGWKYFYNDDKNGKVWLIYDGILEGAAQLVGGTIRRSGNNVCSSSSSNDLISYLNGTGIYAGKWDHIKTGIKNTLTAKGIKTEDDQIEVKGSSDVQLFQKAYDQMYPDEKFEVDGSDTSGWTYRFGGAGSFAPQVNESNYSSKSLFFIESYYWLASPVVNNAGLVCISYCFDYFSYDYNRLGARPVVSIPKTAFEQLVK